MAVINPITVTYLRLLLLLLITLILLLLSYDYYECVRDNFLPRFCRAFMAEQVTLSLRFSYILHAFKYIYGEPMVYFFAIIFYFFNYFLFC